MRWPWKARIVVELDNLLCSRYDVELVDYFVIPMLLCDHVSAACFTLEVLTLAPQRHPFGKCPQVHCQVRAALVTPRLCCAAAVWQTALARGNSARPVTSHPA